MQAIRQEYDWIADKLYRIGKKQVLQNFLQRARIYFTNQLIESLEVRARRNIQAKIAVLELS
jgi:predicted metal-dependent HD superfamily phosphohydrolase